MLLTCNLYRIVCLYTLDTILRWKCIKSVYDMQYAWVTDMEIAYAIKCKLTENWETEKNCYCECVKCEISSVQVVLFI